MKRRPSASTDDGAETSSQSPDSSLEPDPDLDLRSRSSPAANRIPTKAGWRPPNGCNGLPSAPGITATNATMPEPLTASPAKVALTTSTQSRGRRSAWSLPIFVFLASALGIAILFSIVQSAVSHEIDPKGCRMSYMRPTYRRFAEFDTEHTRFASKYSLYLYREQGVDIFHKLDGIPVLFIPGNAGSYKQVRPIAAEAANHYYHYLQHDSVAMDAGIRNLDFFTVDFNEDITAFHGQTLLDQAEYLNEAVRYILSLYSDPQRSSRESGLPDPTSVIILGHSMGGVVARTMLVQSNYQANSINTIITMSAPHARPPVTFDGKIVQIYDEINDYWRRAYMQKWANNNPLWHVTLVSIAGGSLDTVVPSDYASLESLVPETHGFTVFTTGIPTVWTSMDHQAILWCDQFRKVVARTLFDVIDIHRASQTKPRAERMRVFKKRFLTGMEPTAEKLVPTEDATTLLTIDDTAASTLPEGERLVLRSLGARPGSHVYLLPIPARDTQNEARFTMLTDTRLDETGDNGQLQVLVCRTLSQLPGTAGPLLPFSIDVTGDASSISKLACKNAVSDVILLPASTPATQHPFYLAGQQEVHPFSYLQYDVQHLSGHDFIAVIDKSPSVMNNFVVAEFGRSADYRKRSEVGLAQLLNTGLSMELAADRPTVVELQIPSVKSSLLAYNLDIRSTQCPNGKEVFAPLIRQYLGTVYESRYFVNARRATVALHGTAPYLPPPMEPNPDDGIAFTLWTDPSCGGTVSLHLNVDIFGSLGKLYMRYRTVFAAFPLLIVTLVLRKQFRVYDETGIFISFSQSLDLSLRQSIPLLLLSLTLLSMSMSSALPLGSNLLYRTQAVAASTPIDFHHNDLLIGTADPFFWFLVPLIGIVCVGVCAVFHYLSLGLVHIIGLLYGLLVAAPAIVTGDERRRAPSPAFVTSTPRRRMITTAVLLLLVSTFIPYQFAYLVACIVQLFTTIRAFRIYSITSSVTNSNYCNYAHSIFLLMLWVLPINLPILAVWIRNLAVHWLTPFSSHHNVLSITPFIFLVETLTTGRMVPQLSSGLRHVTSVLLFATALSAAVYGVSHAYMLHYLVNGIAAWLVIIHSTADPWSFNFVRSIFDDTTMETRKIGKTP
ncbi:PGAP1-like protein-domain-containing protein [Stachybotrys elegans]|uniref:GPI inositol-deacylase n=1 Tax=Stachybotrys elegans TaxID=80388 RepID=A0A8K0WW71_9HYPO|nr:PGAP1-like protein-domain-containing protein [Stachybotrys elegans]